MLMFSNLLKWYCPFEIKLRVTIFVSKPSLKASTNVSGIIVIIIGVGLFYVERKVKKTEAKMRNQEKLSLCRRNQMNIILLRLMNVRETTKRHHPETCSWLRLHKWWNWIFVLALCTLFDWIHLQPKSSTLTEKCQMKFVCVYTGNKSHFHLALFVYFIFNWKTLKLFLYFVRYMRTHLSATECWWIKMKTIELEITKKLQ